MLIEDVDGQGRLFSVTDVFSNDIVEKILSVNWYNIPWHRENLQETWNRRAVCRQSINDIVEPYMRDCLLPIINSKVGKSFSSVGAQWWVDEPGFTVSIHTDGRLPYAMQIYWVAPNENYGTCFYHDQAGTSVRHHFKSIPNTGYLMLNHPNDDGTMPMLWHGMTNPVPERSYRVSTYWRFS